jgi:hypothetical protein
VAETEASIDKPGDFVDQRCERIQQRSREAAVNIRPARLTFRHFEPPACQKNVAVPRGGPQNSDNGAAAVEESKWRATLESSQLC